eukprot:NODE_308_length_10101_cov_0.990102.p7 type:complete len:147 gc:universal NODE_308_length_10101_cov_0.990102:496-936(+)
MYLTNNIHITLGTITVSREKKRTTRHTSNFTSLSCSKIITANQPGSSDNHGCPFKHYGKESLRNALTGSSWGINRMGSFFDQKRVAEAREKVGDIVKLAADQHHQIACSKWMESVIYVQSGQHVEVAPVDHPNGYACTIAGIVNND